MPARSPVTPEYIKHVNTLYHDAAASDYDSKWGIDFGPVGPEQVREKLVKAFGRWPACLSATRSRSDRGPATSR